MILGCFIFKEESIVNRKYVIFGGPILQKSSNKFILADLMEIKVELGVKSICKNIECFICLSSLPMRCFEMKMSTGNRHWWRVHLKSPMFSLACDRLLSLPETYVLYHRSMTCSDQDGTPRPIDDSEFWSKSRWRFVEDQAERINPGIANDLENVGERQQQVLRMSRTWASCLLGRIWTWHRTWSVCEL